MEMHVIRFVVAGTVVVAVTELAHRFPKAGGLILTLPIVSIVTFISVWTRNRDLRTVSHLAQETLILLPLSLPFFVPLALAERLKLGFWPAFAAGVTLSCAAISGWMWFQRGG